jgi:hypothetical protein
MLRQRIDRVPGDIVISARFAQTVVWGAFIVILVLGLIESLYAQSSSTGKTQASVFFGVFIVVCALLWLRRNRRRPRLQVTGHEIRYWDGGGNLSFLLTRAQGMHSQGMDGQGMDGQGELSAAGPPALCLLPPRRDGGYFAGRRLTIPGSGDYLNVGPFRVGQVRQACESRGWRFNDDPELIAREAGRLAGVLRQSRQPSRRLAR